MLAENKNPTAYGTDGVSSIQQQSADIVLIELILDTNNA